MNDSDWLRKHLRGKTQRAVAETSPSMLRRLVGKVLRRVRPQAQPKPKPQKEQHKGAQPQD